MSLNSLCIDGVVLPMRADELHENDPVRVVDGCDQPVFVASDIKDNASILQNARRPEVCLDVSRRLPIGLQRMAMPGEERLFGVGIFSVFVESPKGG